MKVVLRIVAVLFVLIAAFLIYAVIHAVTSPGGARVPVAIGYVIGAAILCYAARWLWLRPGRTKPVAAAGS